jgi:hypothetical protein
MREPHVTRAAPGATEDLLPRGLSARLLKSERV